MARTTLMATKRGTTRRQEGGSSGVEKTASADVYSYMQQGGQA